MPLERSSQAEAPSPKFFIADALRCLLVVRGVGLAASPFANAATARQAARQQCWQSRHFPERLLVGFVSVVAVAWWNLKEWWVENRYLPPRCLVIPAAAVAQAVASVIGRSLAEIAESAEIGDCGAPVLALPAEVEFFPIWCEEIRRRRPSASSRRRHLA